MATAVAEAQVRPAAGSDMICLISHDQFDCIERMREGEGRWPVAG